MTRDRSLGVRQLVLHDADGRYAAVVDLAGLHSAADQHHDSLYSFAQQIDDFLCPHMTIREILTLFKETEASLLIVVDHPADRNILGA